MRALVFTIARHRAIDAGRKTRRRRTDPVALSELVAEVDRGDVAEAALASLGEATALELIATLPLAQAEVVRLRVLGDLSVEETARVVGRRAGAVRALQHRALRRLAAELERLDAFGE